MNTDELLIAQLNDAVRSCEAEYRMIYTDFLDMHQMKIARDYLISCKARFQFYGGYDDAERCRVFILPDYIDWPTEVQELFKVVRVVAPKGSRPLTHRDYLGSLLSLGLDRSVTGDILVRQGGASGTGGVKGGAPQSASTTNGRAGGGGYGNAGAGADIIVEAEIAEFIELNYSKAGRTSLSVEILPIDSLDTGSICTFEKTDTVASLRLDNIVSSAFGLSRSRAQEAIRKELVSVDSLECSKTDFPVSEGSKVVLRGKGKIVISEVGGTSRKGRIFVKYVVYN